MTTLEDVQRLTHTRFVSESEARLDREAQALGVRQCYSAGNATLQQLANATGLSKARIQQIVKDGEA